MIKVINRNIMLTRKFILTLYSKIVFNHLENYIYIYIYIVTLRQPFIKMIGPAWDSNHRHVCNACMKYRAVTDRATNDTKQHSTLHGCSYMSSGAHTSIPTPN